MTGDWEIVSLLPVTLRSDNLWLIRQLDHADFPAVRARLTTSARKFAEARGLTVEVATDARICSFQVRFTDGR